MKSTYLLPLLSTFLQLVAAEGSNTVYTSTGASLTTIYSTVAIVETMLFTSTYTDSNGVHTVTEPLSTTSTPGTLSTSTLPGTTEPPSTIPLVATTIEVITLTSSTIVTTGTALDGTLYTTTYTTVCPQSTETSTSILWKTDTSTLTTGIPTTSSSSSSSSSSQATSSTIPPLPTTTSTTKTLPPITTSTPDSTTSHTHLKTRSTISPSPTTPPPTSTCTGLLTEGGPLTAGLNVTESMLLTVQGTVWTVPSGSYSLALETIAASGELLLPRKGDPTEVPEPGMQGMRRRRVAFS